MTRVPFVSRRWRPRRWGMAVLSVLAAGPLHAQVSTIATTLKVGKMLYSESEMSECTARVPRSMSRVRPPVGRTR